METGPVDPVRAAIAGRCPRCGKGKAFAGPIKLVARCSACDLDIDGFNVGDGPAAFLIFGLGFIIVGLAMWLEFGFGPPWWLHALLWPPLTILLTIFGLRIGKSILLALEYKHEAAEGRLKS